MKSEKRNKNGSLKRLNKVERAYRKGYLQARKDNANCYKALKK